MSAGLIFKHHIVGRQKALSQRIKIELRWSGGIGLIDLRSKTYSPKTAGKTGGNEVF